MPFQSQAGRPIAGSPGPVPTSGRVGLTQPGRVSTPQPMARRQQPLRRANVPGEITPSFVPGQTRSLMQPRQPAQPTGMAAPPAAAMPPAPQQRAAGPSPEFQTILTMLRDVYGLNV